MRISLVLAAAAISLSAPATAAIVFSDGFDAENGGNSALNYSGFANWTVQNGTVDIIRSGDYGIVCRGGAGSCVDLDGSTSNGGELVLNSAIGFASGEVVAGELWLSGNQRNGASESIQVGVLFGSPVAQSGFVWEGPFGTISIPDGSYSGHYLGPSINAGSVFQRFGFQFTAGEAGSLTLSIATSSNDNIGAILDDVSVSVTPSVAPGVPEPATWAMLILGFGLVGHAARRRRAMTA
ncbi:PEPxxWA-CTERM sorting domain-containing protein [Sandaracinobacteroides sp. A072]|uniref:PEPxxWA-CTERM sorting domain-containing protein n=1 Tax=Sandaracinobacteroides sp. A072 TaxID=3461146 RepID=UPI0040418EF6